MTERTEGLGSTRGHWGVKPSTGQADRRPMLAANRALQRALAAPSTRRVAAATRALRFALPGIEELIVNRGEAERVMRGLSDDQKQACRDATVSLLHARALGLRGQVSSITQRDGGLVVLGVMLRGGDPVEEIFGESASAARQILQSPYTSNHRFYLTKLRTAQESPGPQRELYLAAGRGELRMADLKAYLAQDPDPEDPVHGLAHLAMLQAQERGDLTLEDLATFRAVDPHTSIEEQAYAVLDRELGAFALPPTNATEVAERLVALNVNVIRQRLSDARVTADETARILDRLRVKRERFLEQLRVPTQEMRLPSAALDKRRRAILAEMGKTEDSLATSMAQLRDHIERVRLKDPAQREALQFCVQTAEQLLPFQRLVADAMARPDGERQQAVLAAFSTMEFAQYAAAIAIYSGRFTQSIAPALGALDRVTPHDPHREPPTSLGITPVQRLPRWVLLLKDILKATPDKDNQLKEATRQTADQVGAATTLVNETTRTLNPITT